jgi:hypothetical protein
MCLLVGIFICSDHLVGITLTLYFPIVCAREVLHRCVVFKRRSL